jgi:hypothetical protein
MLFKLSSKRLRLACDCDSRRLTPFATGGNMIEACTGYTSIHRSAI